MYRLLARRAEVRERRDQLQHLTYAAPELLARRPNELWSWDITKLLGPAKWTYFYLYVMLDVFSRYVMGTMTSPERIFALIRSVEYVVKHQVPGDIVECGVWKGGSMMAVAKTLLRLDDASRALHLFDTFEGMPPPTDVDRNYRGVPAARLLETQDQATAWVWAYAPLAAVRENLVATGYDRTKLHFVKGQVEQTLPMNAPDRIALLRLDTDWYESTHHELVHLFPRLSAGGVLIIDDYGHWAGVRRAVDEYLERNRIPLLLNRIDYTGRIGVKIGG